MVNSRVRGDKICPPKIEIGKTHVYIRENIELKTDDEIGEYYEWDEEVLLLNEYINYLIREDELNGIAIILTHIMNELDGE